MVVFLWRVPDRRPGGKFSSEKRIHVLYQLTVVIIVSENVIGTKENLLNCLGKNLLFGLTEREKFFIDKASAIYFTANAGPARTPSL